MSHTQYEAEILRWRHDREAGLRSPGGWLSITGLHWLKAGSNVCGSDPACDVILVGGHVPARAFTITVDSHGAHGEPAPGVAVKTPQGLLAARPLHSDMTAQPDTLFVGSVNVQLLERNGQFALRVRDPEAAVQAILPVQRWFPVRTDARINARFVRHSEPGKLAIDDVFGQTYQMENPGYAVFQMDGQELRLEAIRQFPTAQQLMYVFRDRTNGKSTYDGGRYLYAAWPPESPEAPVLLDFNRAFTPPCAFSPYATCPVPPPANNLPVAIEAGEMAPGPS